eukprot:4323861-Amphidinium_carterae.2
MHTIVIVLRRLQAKDILTKRHSNSSWIVMYVYGVMSQHWSSSPAKRAIHLHQHGVARDHRVGLQLLIERRGDETSAFEGSMNLRSQ